MVAPAAGGTPRVLRHFAGDPIPFQPAWSPDGKRLVFPLDTAKQLTKQTDVLEAINVLDVTTGAMTQITPLALGASDPDWSPDGRRIVFNSQGGHSPFVYVVNPDGSGLRKITRRTRVFSRSPSDPTTAMVAQFQPSWSPDGRRILFTNEPKPCSGRHRDSCSRDPKDAQPHNVFVMNPDGTGVRRLTRSPRFEAQPTWARAR
jgi:Tol biopolymer transport system component